ncbi:hypothetical protein YB2330_004510 [Saitoella coloradoensis]
MVSFVCEVCQDTVKKPKLDQHRSRCHGAYFTCVDCNTTFNGPSEYKSHTSCVSEAQRYQKALYKPTKKELKKQQHEEKKEVVSAPAVAAKKVVEEKEESKKRSHDEMETESAPTEKKSKDSKKEKKEKSESDIVAILSDLVGDESLSLHKLLKKLRKKEGKEEKDDERFLKKIALRKEGDKIVVVKA